ncbi:MAG TPA: ABC transporter permease [Thermoanaerobaculia bacterium]|jgi:lipopolysaccharide transport system permease protein
MSATHPAQPAAPTVVIRPTSGWAALRLGEVWEYRELLFFLAWRDVKIRYKQTVLGAAWAVLQPLLTMVVFTIFFGNLAKVGSDGLPYPIFSYTGLLPWTLFSQALTLSSASLVASSNLIKKVYFPRIVIPMASVLSGVIDFGVSLVALLGLMAWYKIWPSILVLWLPLIFLLALAASLGAGLWLATLNVEYRDVRYVVPFLVQIWLFVTPVIYPASRVTAKLAEHGLPGWIYGLNPMAGVVEGFRWSLLGRTPFPGQLILTSTLVTLVMLVTGSFYLRRMEATFADVV